MSRRAKRPRSAARRRMPHAGARRRTRRAWTRAEQLRTVAWTLVALSLGCTFGLQLALRQGIEQWSALPLVLLLHGAQLSAVLAHGLSWRRGGASLHWAAAAMTYVTTFLWMSTWLEPLRDLGAWLQTIGTVLAERGLPW
jgi:hypothetical protein